MWDGLLPKLGQACRASNITGSYGWTGDNIVNVAREMGLLAEYYQPIELHLLDKLIYAICKYIIPAKIDDLIDLPGNTGQRWDTTVIAATHPFKRSTAIEAFKATRGYDQVLQHLHATPDELLPQVHLSAASSLELNHDALPQGDLETESSGDETEIVQIERAHVVHLSNGAEDTQPHQLRSHERSSQFLPPRTASSIFSPRPASTPQSIPKIAEKMDVGAATILRSSPRSHPKRAPAPAADRPSLAVTTTTIRTTPAPADEPPSDQGGAAAASEQSDLAALVSRIRDADAQVASALKTLNKARVREQQMTDELDAWLASVAGTGFNLQELN